MKEQAQKISDETDHHIAPGIKEIQLDDLSVIYMALLLCNLKHTSWSYEKEFRCTTGALAKNMPYIEAKILDKKIGQPTLIQYNTHPGVYSIQHIAYSMPHPTRSKNQYQYANEYSQRKFEVFHSTTPYLTINSEALIYFSE